MTTQPKAVQPIREGYHSVTPWIISREAAKLLDFLSKAFGAEELGRVYNEDGAIGHAEVKLGDSVVMVFDAREEMAKRAAEPPYREAMRSFQESLEREMKRRSAAESRTEASR